MTLLSSILYQRKQRWLVMILSSVIMLLFLQLCLGQFITSIKKHKDQRMLALTGRLLHEKQIRFQATKKNTHQAKKHQPKPGNLFTSPLNELRILGTLQLPNRCLMMIRDPAGKMYTATEGMSIGKEQARIIKITQDAIILQQMPNHTLILTP